MQRETETALVEAILFLESDPITVSNLARSAHLPHKTVQIVLSQLRESYKDSHRGIELISLDGAWQIVPKQILWEQLKAKYGKDNIQKLSRAAMETLSIIAYSQPVTKSEVDNIRGVSSDSIIRLLLGKDLVQEMGRKDILGRPIQYGTTINFLRVFQLSSLSELPQLDEVEQLRFESVKDK